MENFEFPKHTSAPSYPKSATNNEMSKSYSSVTHPSVSSRSREHLESIFKKLNSGNNVLSRIPTRLGPNVEFSDDEDEEPAETVIKKPTVDDLKSKSILSKATEKENQKKFFAESMKTPEPLHSRSVLNSVYLQDRKVVESIKSQENMIPRCFSTSKYDLKSTSHKPIVMPKPALNLFAKPNDVLLSTSKPNSELLSVSKPKLPDSINREAQPKDTSSITEKVSSSLPNDIIKVNNKMYNVLSLLGSGGSCKVYSVYDTQDKVRVAIKRVNLRDTDPLVRKGYEQEIEYLKKLQNSNRVIKMYDYEYCENELFLVLEHGDIDLSKYLSNEAKLKRLTPLKIKFYWAQMLEAVAEIHKYGIVHSDLKPANFLLVAGNLKLIDFGIATSVPEDKTSTFRDTQVGTLNYMSPEAITQMSADSKQPCFKVGVKSDVWSLGCILYNLVYGVTPFHNIRSLMQKIYAITNPNYEIPFKNVSDPLLLDVLQSCLKRNPKERASVEELLKHPYLSEENSASTSTASANPNPDIENVLKQMQGLTPRRMRYITKVVQELSGKSNP